MKKIIFMALLLFPCLMVSSSYASWLIYHKPEFKGKVIDAETKAPIEGAAVAVYYMTRTYNLAGGSNRVINTRETLTDSNGEFVIPSYTTMISPFTTSHEARFVIYKPGYAGYPTGVSLCKKPERYFSTEKLDAKGECLSGGVKYTFTYGVVEFPKLKTPQQRIRAIPSPYKCGSKEFPLLFKLINEENKRFGLGEVN